jgi:hypothetical protein
MIYATLTPIGGILSLLIFLSVQPGAYKLLCSVLACGHWDPSKDDAAADDQEPPVMSANSSAAFRYDEEDGYGGAAEEAVFHQRDSGSAAALSVAALSSLHGGSRLALASAFQPDNSLSTVFSATARSSLHLPRRLADLSEEQLVDVIAMQATAERQAASTDAAGGGASLAKSPSGNDLHRALLLSADK